MEPVAPIKKTVDMLNESGGVIVVLVVLCGCFLLNMRPLLLRRGYIYIQGGS